MMRIALGRILVGIVLAVWGALFFVLAVGFEKPLNPFDSGAGAFPMIISASLALLSAGLVFVEFRRLNLPESIRVKRLGPIVIAAGLMILYVIAIPFAGYYVATLAFVPAMLITTGEFRWKWLLLITAILLLFNYLSFDRLLGVPLPKIGTAFVK